MLPTSKAKIESEPWVTDEYISARLQAYNCKDPVKKKSNIKELRALQSKLMNRFYQKTSKEISEGFEAREAERYFRQAEDLQGPLKHTVQKPLCTELEFVQHFSSHFKRSPITAATRAKFRRTVPTSYASNSTKNR